MGFISRNVFPACETMCVCCPALRPRSKHPAKRYKKLLGEIFPKSPDGAPNERKIVKLCEYAAKNPIRIPKIAKILEERCYKDLRSEQMKFINIVTEAYNKMLCHCKDQMAYFATSLLNVVTELLENSKEDTPTILGCQTLTRFIYSQVDGTYTHSIEKFAHKVCSLAREQGDEHQKQCLRASGLQCLSAMVWFMGEFSHIFAAFDEIVHAILDNYEANMIVQTNEDREEQNCNWVNEVIRCEGRGIGVSGCNSPSYMVVRPRTARKDPTLLTKEEAEMPKVWAQISHEIFSVILLPSSGQTQAGLASVRASGYLNESKNLRSDTTSAFTSIAARLDKLRKEKDGVKIEKNGYNEDLKNYKSSPNFHKLNSMIDRTAGGVSLADMLPSMMKFTEDQMGQLLSAFWTQATLPDNLPTSIEAIAHSLSLVLLSLRLKNPDDGLVVRAFQLLFSLRNLSLDLNNGTLPTVCKRLILALSTSTLMFAAKIYQIPHICKILKSQLPGDVDPYLFIGDDLQLHVKPHANMKDFGSSSDSQMATSMLFEMRSKVELSNTIITDVVAKNLSKVSKLQEADVQMQLSEPFTPDDAFMFGSRPIVESGPNQSISKESLSFDEDVHAGSMVEDEVTSELSVRFQPRGSPSSSTPQVISIGQLMESALEVAGQVVVSSVSTSPLPYDTMTNRCETFGTGTRQKLSRWLATENRQVNGLYRNSSEESSALEKVTEDGSIYGRECGVFQDTWSMMSLPPASPFDNFLKAAGAGR
ncbi:hypothetical protein BRARA_I00488 [Brassica rapa]|uniref:Uncharacterized protein n=2 Tax=Brassica campestris TaxID=3711 RepID=A0A397XYU0_BRACM|nr:hypothetical protein BRARA_I00488 [Brassica rapa]